MKPVLSLCAAALLGLAGCTRAESQSGLTLEAKLPGGFGQLSNVVELDSGRVAFADTRDKLFLDRRVRRRRSGHAGHQGRGDQARRGTGRVQVPRVGRPAGGRHRGPGGFQRAAHHALGPGRASRSRVLPIAPVAGDAPVLVYDTVGHGYKIDYKTMLAPAPGETTRPDSVPVLRIQLAGGKVDTVARPRRAGVRRGRLRRAEAAGRDGVRAERFLRRAGQRHAPGWRGAGTTGWTGGRPTGSGAGARAGSSPGSR